MNVGLYGGTFSPPHKGHTRAAELFFAEASLERLYVMPAGDPPHKKTDKWGDAKSRLEMTRLAFCGIAEVSDYEISKEGRSFTVDTLRYLKSIHPEDRLFMLVGEDMFLSLDSWREPENIMRLCTVVAMRRKDTPLSLMEKAREGYVERYGADVMIIDDEPFEASSSLVREMIGKGEDISALVSAPVLEYIEKNGLYRDEN